MTVTIRLKNPDDAQQNSFVAPLNPASAGLFFAISAAA
jgi:hypothetical protein